MEPRPADVLAGPDVPPGAVRAVAPLAVGEAAVRVLPDHLAEGRTAVAVAIVARTPELARERSGLSLVAADVKPDGCPRAALVPPPSTAAPRVGGRA